jgi:type II secretory pathway component PulF
MLLLKNYNMQWNFYVGFFVTIWVAAIMFKSNDILKKQTALKVPYLSPLLCGSIICNFCRALFVLVK